MIRLLCGRWTDDGGDVVFFKGIETKKQALDVSDNILLSANLFGDSEKRHDIAFTIPIMYLSEDYTQARIYFLFEDFRTKRNYPVTSQTNFIPAYFFFTFNKFTENSNRLMILKIDTLIWSFMKTGMNNKEEFNLLHTNLKDIIMHRKALL
ncbi:MAG: hypothetical protein ACXAC7_00975 [Candidatus Hodarchaeales archaeon]